MAKDTPKITATQRFKLKQIIKQLEQHRGRGTELVSVYVPAGYEISKITTHLAQEQGTATNIKSSSTRKNVIDALERMIQHLKLYERTPKNGIAAFSGNVAEREGQSDVQVWSVEPPAPMNQRLYRCDKEFVLDPLRDMAEDKNVYGMIVMDKREATIAMLKGKTIIPLVSTRSAVPGKTKAGGQCLDPSTLVQLFDGDIKPIKDIRIGDQVASSTVTGKIVSSTVRDVWTSHKPTLTITTKNPRMQITCSEDHTVLTTSDGLTWQAAKELAKGSKLVFPERLITKCQFHTLKPQLHTHYTLSSAAQAMLRQQRQKHNWSQKELARRVASKQSLISRYERGQLSVPRKTFERIVHALNAPELVGLAEKKTDSFPPLLTPAFGQLIGYFLGDGYVDNTRIGFCEDRKEVAEKYGALVETLFGKKPSIRFRKSKGYYEIRACIGSAAQAFKNTFPELSGALTSTIPQRILTSPPSVVAAFLKGLFDAEGYVSSQRIGLGMNNRKVIVAAQMLLLRFGIIASVLTYNNHRNPYSNNTRYTLVLSEHRGMQKFSERIGFSSSEKQALLSQILSEKSSKSLVRQVIVLGSEVRDRVYEGGRNLEDYPRVNNFFRDERNMSKHAFAQSVLSNTPTASLTSYALTVLSHNLLPAEVVSISYNPEPAELFDISVDHENFIANGLVVHNSAQRFERLRDGAAKEFYRKVGEYVKNEFYHNQDLKGILLGGPGHTKEEFLEEGQLPDNLKEKFIATLDLSYTGEFGLQELLERAEDVLAAEDVMEEKKAVQRFFSELSKNTGLAGYGKDEVMRLIQLGAVELLLLSETLDDATIKEFEDHASNMGTEVLIISLETREGAQLKEIGGVAAVLRYAVEF